MALVISSTTPQDGKNDLSVSTALYVLFNQEILTTHLTALRFNLIKVDTMTPVKATIAYHVDDGEYDYTQVTVTPVSALFKNTAYRLYVNKGIESNDGDTLQRDFILDFITGGAEVAVPEAPSAPEDVFVGNELRIIRSTPGHDAFNSVGNQVVIVFNQGVPDSAVVLIEARDPLGWPLSAADPWAAAAATTIDGRTITVAPVDTEILLAQNRIYKLEVVYADNELVPTVEFMTVLTPSYSTVDEVRLEYGQASQDLSNFELLLHLHRISIEAALSWNHGVADVPTATPYYLKEYVKFRTVQQLMVDETRNSRSTGHKSVTLGDMKVTLRDLDKEALSDVNGMVAALYEKVWDGSTATIPLNDGTPGYALIGLKGKTADIGIPRIDLEGLKMIRALPSDPRRI
jgi:hypothetical protein